MRLGNRILGSALSLAVMSAVTLAGPALAESTRSHLAYNLVIAGIVILALATGST